MQDACIPLGAHKTAVRAIYAAIDVTHFDVSKRFLSRGNRYHQRQTDREREGPRSHLCVRRYYCLCIPACILANTHRTRVSCVYVYYIYSRGEEDVITSPLFCSMGFAGTHCKGSSFTCLYILVRDILLYLMNLNAPLIISVIQVLRFTSAEMIH